MTDTMVMDDDGDIVEVAKKMGADTGSLGNLVGVDAERAARAYVKIREARSALAAKFKEEDEKLKHKLSLLEAGMLDFLNKTNQKSAKTEIGTFYKQLEILPTGSDWSAFYGWVKKNDAFEFLERRIKKTAVADFMEQNDGNAPPGVSVLKEWKVVVRRGGKE